MTQKHFTITYGYQRTHNIYCDTYEDALKKAIALEHNPDESDNMHYAFNIVNQSSYESEEYH